MSDSKAADLLQTGLALAELGQSVASGKIPDPVEVIRAMSSVFVTLAPVDDLKAHLEAAARRRQDVIAELAGVAKLGPRPG